MKLLEGEVKYGREIVLLTDSGERIRRKVRYDAKHGHHIVYKDKIYTSEDISEITNEVSIADLAKHFCRSGISCNDLREAVNKSIKMSPIIDQNGGAYCPSCNDDLEWNIRHPRFNFEKPHYCKRCGQHINWKLE